MSVQYTNRIGKSYTLCEGKTKTLKPRYFFTTQKKAKGEPLKHIPQGYEIYEHPENAQVFLRKIRPQMMTDNEKQLIEQLIKQMSSDKRYLADHKDQFITIYESSSNTADLKNLFAGLIETSPVKADVNTADLLNKLVDVATPGYTAILRFELVDVEERQFIAQRFCSRGAIDDWIHLAGSGKLDKLAKKYMERLGTEAFYEYP
ncbi:MAG: hypothetical protein ACI8WB_005102 [Phenylobacterium sp.]|jgi:hypothetical protein